MLFTLNLHNVICQLQLNNGEGNGNPFQYSCLETPWMEEPGGLESMGPPRVGHDRMTNSTVYYGNACKQNSVFLFNVIVSR